MSTEMRSTPAEYPVNALTDANAYEGSSVIKFPFAGLEYAVGFWGTEYPTGSNKWHPYLAMIVNSPDGWVTLGYVTAMWNDELKNNADPSNADIDNLMEEMSTKFTPYMKDYADEHGTEEAVIPNWRRVLARLATIRAENGEIVT